MKNEKNIFWGDNESDCTEMAFMVYNRLKTREWISYEDVLQDFHDKTLSIVKIKEERQKSLKDRKGYNSLKKVFPKICKAINKKYPDSIKEAGNNRCRRFRYTGEDDDPLADLVNAKVISDIREYFRFCQDSAGFFPISWLEYFFRHSRDLIDIEERRHKGEQLLTSSIDRNLTNIELLPQLYDCIKKKRVIEFDYKPYDEEKKHLIFHPQHLREYNGRWHLLGNAEGMEPEWSFNVALDRIVGGIEEIDEPSYHSAPQGFYDDFFANLVGVTHKDGEEPYCVRIRAHGLKIFKLVETKCLHRSQQTVVPYGEHDDGEYGEFEVKVEMNNEFIGCVLQLGPGLEVMAPENVRNVFAERVREMYERYGAKQSGTNIS